MTTLANLESQLRSLLGASSKFYPSKKAQVNDYYEAYLWAEMIYTAVNRGWTVTYTNAGASNNEFNFRMGPGVLNSKTLYTYANLDNGAGKKGELHIGVRVEGDSGILHEFDVVAFNDREVANARTHKKNPDHNATRLHIEAKFHTNDLSLAVARGIVGLQTDCPTIHGLLVSRGKGSDTLRQLLKHHNASYVHYAVPGGRGVTFLRYCFASALTSWRP